MKIKKNPYVWGVCMGLLASACAWNDGKTADGLPEGFVPEPSYRLVYEDEFTDSLNLDDWMYRTGERLGGYNLPENVFVKDGRLFQQMVFKELNGKKEITGGGVITRRLFGYGYYETKCKLFSGTGGMHSSFWSMGLGGGDGEQMPVQNVVYEIDGYEVDSHTPRKLTCNLNTYIGERNGAGSVADNNFPTDQEFILGYEWLPTKINWYVNGKLVQTKTVKDCPIHYAQQNVWLTALAHVTQEKADESKLPGCSSWDYFRFYAAPLKDVNLIGAGEFEYNQNPDFSPSSHKNPQHPIAWMELGDQDASLIEDSRQAAGGNNVLAHRKDADYRVTTAQRLYYIANGTYNFEAYVRSSGGQQTAKVRISGFNGNQVKEVEIPRADQMTKIAIEGVEVKDNGAYVEIISDARAGQWLQIDNVNFHATMGRVVEKALPYTSDFRGKVYGETVVTNEDAGFKSGGYRWDGSSLSGYYRTNSVYSFNRDKTAWAEFEVVVPANDVYDIKFYKLIVPGSAGRMKVLCSRPGGEKVSYVNLSEGEKGWALLERASLKKGDKVKVRITGEEGGTLRASAVALTPEGTLVLDEALILAIDTRQALFRGRKVPVSDEAGKQIPYLKDGKAFLPLRFICDKLGVECPAGRLEEMVSLDELKQLLASKGWQVTWVPADLGKEHIVIAPQACKVTPELQYNLFSIL